MTFEKEKNSTKKKWTARILLAAFDIFAVNFAYFAALVIRFYVNHTFHAVASIYFPAFFKFAPYYTVCCIAVFAFFKLYSSILKYAGINDLNRILAANAVTCLIQIVGSVLFVKRMPITYYAIGAVIQFAMIFASRFAYRFVAIEAAKYSKDKNDTSVNVMIVGTGESAKILLRQFASDRNNIAHPVCVVDYRGQEAGYLFDGLPVIGGIDNIKSAAEKYKVKSVIIADSLMPQEVRTEIRQLCKKNEIDVQDFSGYAHDNAKGITLYKLMEYTTGPVEVMLDGVALNYANGEEAIMALPDRYLVKSVTAENGPLVVEIVNDTTVINNINDTWVNEYQKQTGEDVSFF
ncbi:MAG: hypothetical protein K6F23_05145 [Solobacterium sp.]|nr:hypothetical protein [Solobacterium sp.]